MLCLSTGFGAHHVVHHRKKVLAAFHQRLRTHTLPVPSYVSEIIHTHLSLSPWSFVQCFLSPGSERRPLYQCWQSLLNCKSQGEPLSGAGTGQKPVSTHITTSCLFSSFLTPSLLHLLPKPRVSEPEPEPCLAYCSTGAWSPRKSQRRRCSHGAEGHHFGRKLNLCASLTKKIFLFLNLCKIKILCTLDMQII